MIIKLSEERVRGRKVFEISRLMLQHLHIYSRDEFTSRTICCFWLSPTSCKADPLEFIACDILCQLHEVALLLPSPCPSPCPHPHPPPCPCLLCLCLCLCLCFFSHLELQQRACEYLVLPTVGQEIMETVMNSMPPYLDKGNALMNMHEVGSCSSILRHLTLATLPCPTLSYPTLPYLTLPTLP